MTRLDDPKNRADHLESALEASCDALITLESIPSRASGELGDAQRTRLHVTQATELLRHAIMELRLAYDPDGTLLALGFVIRGEQAASGARGKRTPQTRPRRTA